ncbi:hypothetical protein AA313_de0200129 [Arthrobotrys entomopaga]|nr:hypothetical protein AA313_de0200129 [Arthrobotrys entomopaga]
MDLSELVNLSGDMEGWVQSKETKEREPALNLRYRQETAGDRGDGAASSNNVLAPLQSEIKRVRKRRLRKPKVMTRTPTAFSKYDEERLLEFATEEASTATLASTVCVSEDPPERDQHKIKKDKFLPQSRDKRVEKRQLRKPKTAAGPSKTFSNPIKKHILEALIEEADKRALVLAVCASGDPPERDQDDFDDDKSVSSSEDEEMTDNSASESTIVRDEEEYGDTVDDTVSSGWSNQETDSRSSVWSGVPGNRPGPSDTIRDYTDDPDSYLLALRGSSTRVPQIEDHRGRSTGASLEDFDDLCGAYVSRGSMDDDGSQEMGVESDGATIGDQVSEDQPFERYERYESSLDISEDGENAESPDGSLAGGGRVSQA